MAAIPIVKYYIYRTPIHPAHPISSPYLKTHTTMKPPSPALALALPLSSASHACNPTAKTIVTTLNHTPTTSTLHMFQTLSNFAPDPNLCGVNTTIGVPPGYKGSLLIKGKHFTG